MEAAEAGQARACRAVERMLVDHALGHTEDKVLAARQRRQLCLGQVRPHARAVQRELERVREAESLLARRVVFL